jgi:hypothetical protein
MPGGFFFGRGGRLAGQEILALGITDNIKLKAFIADLLHLKKRYLSFWLI